MPPGRRRKVHPRTKAQGARRRKVQQETVEKPAAREAAADGRLFRGLAGELVMDGGGKRGLTVWMLAWRCKRCGYTWPVRKARRTTGPAAGTVLVPKPLSDEPTEIPKKCAGCGSPLWWKDYQEPLEGGRRQQAKDGGRRKPSMVKGWGEAQEIREQEELEAPPPSTLAEVLSGRRKVVA